MSCLDELGKRILYWDGGMGSLLQKKGLKGGELPELWNLTHREEVTEIHRQYLEAGADIIDTNTFGANPLKFPAEGQYSLEKIIEAAFENAKEARRQSGREDAVIALDVGPTGKLLKPLGNLDFEDAVGLFAQVMRFGKRFGADLILIETMSDAYEAKAAVLAAKEETDLPVVVTTVYGDDQRLLTGTTPAAVVAAMEGLGVDALGVNCGMGPVQMKEVAKELLRYASVPVAVNPNAGIPRSENGETVYDVAPEEFAQIMAGIAKEGAWIVGGCCGTTPEHIRRTKELCSGISPVPIKQKNRCVVSSYGDAVEFDSRKVIIGERINPTGKKRLKEALLSHDMDYILQEGQKQEENGADILDVNVGLPGIDEPALMTEAIEELQSAIRLPLQIDTSNITAMERAMRRYNGKPMINSVNGKQESMEAVFPLVKKYGGVVVALLLDENGIPDTADGRIEIAKKIYRTAEEYGVSRDDIILDALAMTISSDTGAAAVTLETIRRIRDELHGRSLLGVSNISFGLPLREIINSSFYTMALQNGLNAAILNPGSDAMMRAWYAYCALANLDPQCQRYIERYAEEAKNQKTKAPQKTGKRDTAAPQHPTASQHPADSATGESAKQEAVRAIQKGRKEQAAHLTAGLLRGGASSLSVINETIVPALDLVGQGFEKGSVFLPQLLMSAEAAKASFEEVRKFLEQSGTKQVKKGKIVLATVKGDIHDIGKNIVKVLLENYGYEVYDLGRDVEPQLVVDKTKETGAPLVGLSALMTTTVVNMEATIRLLHEQLPEVKIVVGGAVLTEAYAKQIGADCYAKDAMATVRYAEEIFA